MQRRDFIKGVGAGALALNAGLLSEFAEAEQNARERSALDMASDESYWQTIRKAYACDPHWIDLAGGGTSTVPKTVLDTTLYTLKKALISPKGNLMAYFPMRAQLKQRLARLLNVTPDEIALLRNDTEAMHNAILGIPLKPGDEVITTQQDYPSMVAAWRQREKREDIILRVVETPIIPRTQEELVRPFAQAITPRTRVFSFCHVLCDTGQIYPAERLCALARRHGILSVVDGAHGFGHIPCDLSAIGCDYYANSLHKWPSAPLGNGFLFIRRERIAATYPLFSPGTPLPDDNILKFEATGTRAPTAVNVLPAIDLLESIGIERKAARCHYLKRYWADKLADVPNIRIHTNLESEHSCGLANVGVKGIQGHHLSDHLQSRYRVLTYGINVPETSGLQVSTQVYVSLADLDKFVAAMKTIARDGLPTNRKA